MGLVVNLVGLSVIIYHLLLQKLIMLSHRLVLSKWAVFCYKSLSCYLIDLCCRSGPCSVTEAYHALSSACVLKNGLPFLQYTSCNEFGLCYDQWSCDYSMLLLDFRMLNS